MTYYENMAVHKAKSSTSRVDKRVMRAKVAKGEEHYIKENPGLLSLHECPLFRVITLSELQAFSLLLCLGPKPKRKVAQKDWFGYLTIL